MARKAETTSIDMSDRSYRRVRVIGKDGKARHSAHNDDAVARAMLTFSAAGGKLDTLIKANGLKDKYPDGEAGAKNRGLFRMALGGTLRSLVRAGTPVVIGDITVKTLEQRVADPDIGAAKPVRAKAKAKTARKRKAPVAEAA